jgi:hypothetical protein
MTVIPIFRSAFPLDRSKDLTSAVLGDRPTVSGQEQQAYSIDILLKLPEDTLKLWEDKHRNPHNENQENQFGGRAGFQHISTRDWIRVDYLYS